MLHRQNHGGRGARRHGTRHTPGQTRHDAVVSGLATRARLYYSARQARHDMTQGSMRCHPTRATMAQPHHAARSTMRCHPRMSSKRMALRTIGSKVLARTARHVQARTSRVKELKAHQTWEPARCLSHGLPNMGALWSLVPARCLKRSAGRASNAPSVGPLLEPIGPCALWCSAPQQGARLEPRPPMAIHGPCGASRQSPETREAR